MTDLTALDELKAAYAKLKDHPEFMELWPADVLPVLVLAFRALADKDAEIARLQAELDAASDVPVEYVTEAGLAAAMAADPHREDGMVLRTTDGERKAFAWRKAAGEWAALP